MKWFELNQGLYGPVEDVGGFPADGMEAALADAEAGSESVSAEEFSENAAGGSVLLGADGEAQATAPGVRETGSAADFEGIEPPEGYPKESWDGESLRALAPTFSELGLTRDQVTRVVHGYAALIQERQTQQAEASRAYTAQLEREIAQTYTPEQIADARRCFNKMATPEMRELFRNPVLGSNKALVGIFVEMAALTRDDSLPGGRPGETVKERTADLFYPTM